MTSDKQRIAIAQACGWTHIYPRVKDTYDEGKPYGFPPGLEIEPRYSGLSSKLPDYLNDLNAMHEAEKCCLTNAKLEEAYYFAIDRNHCATAAQRAEAFLRTLNLWTTP
jgi:hypothetical protein